jgi:hypothetical protein
MVTWKKGSPQLEENSRDKIRTGVTSEKKTEVV